MGDQNATLAGRQSQNLQIRKRTQASRGCGTEVDLGLTTQNAGNNVFIEVRVRLEAYLHGFRRWLTSSVFLDSSSFL
jgi:hypothetical protein